MTFRRIPPRHGSFIFLLFLTSLRSCVGVSAQTLTVDAASNQHAISPNIYGIANYGLDATFAEEIKVPNIRWGGDGTTRYNWQQDSSNAGADWYFVGGTGNSNPVPSASADTMIKTYKPAGAGALITIPIIPYVNKTSAYNCSFPISVYGAQQSTNPYVHPNGDSCGNGISPSGTVLTDTNIGYNNESNSVSLQQGWLEHLVATFGKASNGGVPFYQLDNEPGGWGNTHRDIEPSGAAYNTIISLGETYAAMIKQQDSSASVLGPSDFTLGGWIGTPSQQNGLYAGQYYLQQMAAYQAQKGTRILDYFDEHYYPQFTDAPSQLASTRTLWDPGYNGGTWVEQYVFNGPMQLIPRFKQWITQYYPGTKLALSEYSIDSGNKLITDALAEADMLGIFGRQQVDFANMWSAPASTDPIAFAFRLYRNYDGDGRQFGNTSVQAASTNQGALSIYAGTRSSDGALTMVVLNKTTNAINSKLSIANFSSSGSVAVFSYSKANLKALVSQGNISLASNKLTYNYPAYSATVLVVKGSTATQQPIANGTYVVTNEKSHLVIEDPSSSTTSGEGMVQWSTNQDSNQSWKFAYSNGYYTIQNVASGLYLTDPGSATANDTQLQQQSASSSNAQLWSITANGSCWQIRNKASGLNVDDHATSAVNGSPVVLWADNTNPSQTWSIN